MGWGNFGAGPKPPAGGSKAAVEGLLGGFQRPATELCGGALPGIGLEGLDDPLGLLADLAGVFRPGGGHGREHLVEARHLVAAARRPIGAAEKRRPLRREEDRQRPAPAAGQPLHRLHVDLVEVGPLLAVDLDADEVFLQQPGDLGVLEALVAP